MSNNYSDIYAGLVHYPVYDRDRNVVTTSVTNMDVHDIARIGRTYSLKGVFIITPIDIHRDMVERVVSLWKDPAYYSRTPSRKEALELVRTAPSVERAVRVISGISGKEPKLVGTTARRFHRVISYRALRRKMMAERASCWLILFGTGWGLTDQLLEECDFILEPIEAQSPYRHLSVRTACAIVIDRVVGVGR